MGLTKQYLRYVPGPVFNIIATSNCRSLCHLKYPGGVDSHLIATPTCEAVTIWDIRKGEKVRILSAEKEAVSTFTCDSSHQFLAVGYSNGFIRIFCVRSSECTLVFQGHKSYVTSLAYSDDGTRLVSGSSDTDLVVWDIVSESGIVRLHGHKGPITKCVFAKTKEWLVSSSKDTFVKFWDLDTQHCFYTLVGHRCEVWDFLLLRNDTWLITGTSDTELHFWDVLYKDQESLDKIQDQDDSIISCLSAGTVVREGKGRLISLKADSSEQVICYHGSNHFVELYKLLSDEETKHRIKKRLKKERKKKSLEDNAETVLVDSTMLLQDRIQKLPRITTNGKVKAVDIAMDSDCIKIFTTLHNNSAESYAINLNGKESSSACLSNLWMPGHRTDIRTVCFTSDNSGILSASADSVKLWNRATQQCIRTIDCSNALSSCFTPGDRHCVIGTKNGKLQLFDLASGNVLESLDAHEGPVWSVCVAPDQRGFVSGSGDHDVKFWDFELVKHEHESSISTVLSVVHVRTLKMSDDVLSVKFSPDHRLLAVALLDSTVKVFFVDTLKFFLSLYGHKLPVLCMDICYDSSLLITGSADRNIKIWGLDFGDCRRSLFAHSDSIMCVQFVPETHLFFSGGKDGIVSHWDADSFEKIISFQNHHGEVWAMAVSPNGHYVVSAAHDKAIRLWQRTQEPLILEEEREMEREQEEEKTLIAQDSVIIPGQNESEASLAGQKSVETTKAAERLMEGLDICTEEMEKLTLHQLECTDRQKKLPLPQPHPLMVAYESQTPEDFLLQVIKRIKSSEMEKALLVLPFDYVQQLLQLLNVFLDKGWETELVCRCLFFLIRIHQGQIANNEVLLPIFSSLKEKTLQRLNEIKDVVNFNMAGLLFIKQHIESKQQMVLFEDASIVFGEKRKKKQKREKALKRAILAL